MHTKGPLTYGHVGDDFWIGDNSDGLNNIARVYWEMGEIPEGRDNASRIVACWNACIDFDTDELLEKYDGVSMTLKFIMDQQSECIKELRRQRDELLGALENLLGCLAIASVMPDAINKVYVPRMDAPELEQARAAIRKARGEL